MAGEVNGANGAGAPGESGGWVIDLDLIGITPASGKMMGGGPQITKSGVYKALIKSSSRFTAASGFDTVKFDLTIVGGEFDGYDATVILPGVPDATKDPQGTKWKARWKALAANTAKDPANLEKTAFKFGTGAKSNPVGKEVFVYVRSYPAGTMDPKNPQYEKKPDTNFMAPAEAKAELDAEARIAAMQGKAAPAAGAHVQATAPAAQAAAPANDPLAEV